MFEAILDIECRWGKFEINRIDFTNSRIAAKVVTFAIGGFGVESTARTAAAFGFDVVFVEDAMTSMDADAHRFAVEKIFPRLGRVRRADQLNLQS